MSIDKMEVSKLNRKLVSIGKGFFIEWFDICQTHLNEGRPIAETKREILKFGDKGYSTYEGRISGIRSLIKSNNAIPAFEYLLQSKKLRKESPELIQRATELLDMLKLERMDLDIRGSRDFLDMKILKELEVEQGRYNATEGERKTSINPSRLVRDSGVALKAKERDGFSCRACDFYFDDRIVHAHHLNPLAEGERDTEVDDLVTLCPTCHAVAHYLLNGCNGELFKCSKVLIQALKELQS